MISLNIVKYFYYLCVLTLVVKEFLDQKRDLGSDIPKLSQLIKVNSIFVLHQGRTSTSYTR